MLEFFSQLLLFLLLLLSQFFKQILELSERLLKTFFLLLVLVNELINHGTTSKAV